MKCKIEKELNGCNFLIKLDLYARRLSDCTHRMLLTIFLKYKTAVKHKYTKIFQFPKWKAFHSNQIIKFTKYFKLVEKIY